LTASYVGSPWRSRFLRAPKVALELASRPDFVALGELATLQLGLKSGADSFFFVRPLDQRRVGQSRGSVLVSGMRGAWQGRLAASDLRAAVLNPHELFVDDRRRLLIPSRQHYYLAPRSGRLREELSSYVEVGERAGINHRPLVRQNSTSRWFVQARGVISSRWALPYSSGYDYGAWDNRAGAVLNGRFVGAEPLHGVDSFTLGAVLNSTLTLVGRLLVGTTTGVEGAFDVGPPAARNIRVPDIRSLTDEARARVCERFNAWIDRDEMLPAPSRTGHVDSLRHELDIAILAALGLTRGQASALLGKVYESYGRWRASVENVEAMMRANRREMARNRTGRSVNPIRLAAQRVWEELMVDFPPSPAAS
jgi:hypothetical protein